jgi:hypothetical protein
MAKIQQSVNRFVGDEDPKVRLCEDFFLKALSPAQAQLIFILNPAFWSTTNYDIWPMRSKL